VLPESGPEWLVTSRRVDAVRVRTLRGDDFLSSAIAMTTTASGSRNHMKNHPNEPMRNDMSIQLGM
jgi:predicted RNase H-like nuclease